MPPKKKQKVAAETETENKNMSEQNSENKSNDSRSSRSSSSCKKSTATATIKSGTGSTASSSETEKNHNTKVKAVGVGKSSEAEGPPGAESVANTVAQEKVEKKSLIDIYFDKLNAVQDRYTGTNKSEGYMLIVGIKSEDDSSEDEEEESKNKNEKTEENKKDKYTQEQVNKMRHIIVTTNREKCVDKGHEFASNGKSKETISMFCTSDGDEVCFGLDSEIKKCMRKKKIAEKFDALLGLTHGLKTYQAWIYDNECYEEGDVLDKGIASLARAWKKLLRHSDDELEIDPEFTRPGVEALLEGLGKDLKSSEATTTFPFKWRP